MAEANTTADSSAKKYLDSTGLETVFGIVKTENEKMVRLGSSSTVTLIPEEYEKIEYVTCDNYSDRNDWFVIFTGLTQSDCSQASFDVKFNSIQFAYNWECLGFSADYVDEDTQYLRLLAQTDDRSIILSNGQSPTSGKQFLATSVLDSVNPNVINVRYNTDSYGYNIYINKHRYSNDFSYKVGNPYPTGRVRYISIGQGVGENSTPFRIDHYGATIYDVNMTVLRNYIPCIRKSDGKVGFYESVLGEFKTNEGHGDFKCMCHYTSIGSKTVNMSNS